MKTRKSTKLIGMLIALFAFAFIGCSDSGSSDDDGIAGGLGRFNVEVGEITSSDYTAYQTWMGTRSVPAYEDFDEQRDFFVDKTISGTYQNKGRLSESEVRSYLAGKGVDSNVIDSFINSTQAYGAALMSFPKNSNSYNELCWIYIK